MSRLSRVLVGALLCLAPLWAGNDFMGQVPPEVQAAGWLNAEGTPTLAGLTGRVVLIEFWSTT